MRKKKTDLTILLIVILGVVAYFFVQTSKIKNDYTVTIITVNDGYGYTISYHDKLLIKQEQIPAIQNTTAFCSKEDAFTIGELVKAKVIHKENPKITTSELEANNITLNCNIPAENK
ncbi:DUF4907 domain-containing protein [Lacinutrix undariae]